MTAHELDVIQPQPWRWENFPYAELVRVCTGGVRMVPAFLDRLQALRLSFQRPIVLTSAYRSPEHNLKVSTTGAAGPHTTGRAVDVLISGVGALDLVAMAWGHGFTGIGLKQHGQHDKRFLHLDDLTPGPDRPRPWIWTYP